MTSSNVPLSHSSPIASSSESVGSVTPDRNQGDHLEGDGDPPSVAEAIVGFPQTLNNMSHQCEGNQPTREPGDSAVPEAQATYPSWRRRWRTNDAVRALYPRYRLPLRTMFAAAVSSLRHERRNVRTDSLFLVKSMPVPPVVDGIENLPTKPPFVILPNHYERPSGAWVGWGAIVITDAITRARPGSFAIRWVMTSSWQDCYLGPKRIHPKYLHWILRRLSGLYGIILMPADDVDAFGRGAALRDIFRALADPHGQVVAFHPEAGGFETLITPPKGMGRVLTAIDRQGITMIPTGVFEDDGRFQVRFGTAIESGSLQGINDSEAADRVMLRIARLVPERTRGEFAGRLWTDHTATPVAADIAPD